MPFPLMHFVLMAPALVVQTDHSCDALPTDAYAIVTEAGLSLLPEPLGQFLGASIDGEVSPASRHPCSPSDSTIQLDAAATPGSFASLRKAAVAFPRNEDAATKALQRSGVRDPGRLPWAILNAYGRLAQAMRKGDPHAIRFLSLTILQRATDCSLPFNTTTDRAARGLGNVSWNRTATGGEHDANGSVAGRFHRALVGRYRQRLRYEVHAWPGRCMRIDNAVDAVFDTLLDSHQFVERWANWDRELLDSLGVHDALRFQDVEDDYFERLRGVAIGELELRLEAGAVLGAELIKTAWENAESPDPSTWGQSAAKAVGLERKHGDVVQLVGSRSSTVFHRSDCPHVRRIKPSNRVTFPSIEAARREGRRPCQSCRPAGG